ncbi:Inner membrane protein YhhQ [Legionella massiliensis]|uniref:Probable queuosine precursor transporter n=1 Tax=Legionella massiliensis TaxID=1034943 RepID=A0A078KWL2_9GAMM|nr:7-cyano-7-deazaguanine/7-aminomethyl-7-deazaguanine transporter [Legionella massiliensis]CDZ76098.1 Inner membrane protein YhhQ [Legionella massiliensis]CEE11836.1 Inner membrane protein YhhQ [Legionella massiliensis]
MLSREFSLYWLALAHILLICLSNTLVQYPFVLFGFHTTWGAFSYPLIFILTDLTTRLFGQEKARKIIFLAMFPGLICSYLISNFFSYGNVFVANVFALRIALASFCAYVLGQLLDIIVFQRLRENSKWWVAPSVSNIFGNLLDTYVFFFTAFYQCSNAFLSAHWPEIAMIDLLFKISISLLTFVPLYGIVLQLILRKKENYIGLGIKP